ncbi:Virulence protein [Roseobacter fucihabitans]|uniref:Virulence protein n=1 Tax=Roseobacter fucihabitans TaxID=1537242 RepID=A0ABZ2BXP4_9RHOB|nr:VOC family protein [Roseobacter litoralis]MBC6964948.1 Virulence protein [Roseobacter litoralis]
MLQPEIQCRVRMLDHFVLTVKSIPETVRFYTQVLGMRGEQFQAADGTRRWALLFGQTKINLHQQGREFKPNAGHAQPGTADVCFLTDAPVEAWISHLTTHQIDIEDGPIDRLGAIGPIVSLYLRDPDDNLIEVSVPQA